METLERKYLSPLEWPVKTQKWNLCLLSAHRGTNHRPNTCTWPIAIIIPAVLGAPMMPLCISQVTAAPPASAPASGPQDKTELENKTTEDPSQVSQNHLCNFSNNCWKDDPLLRLSRDVLSLQDLCKQDGALNLMTFPPAPIPNTSRQNQNMPDSLQQHLSSPHPSHLGKWRG